MFPPQPAGDNAARHLERPALHFHNDVVAAGQGHGAAIGPQQRCRNRQIERHLGRLGLSLEQHQHLALGAGAQRHPIQFSGLLRLYGDARK